MTSLFDFVRHATNFLRQQFPLKQCGALCWRETNGIVEILLITSRANKQWIIPKGWPMPGKTLAQAASEEAWEEAGIRGKVQEHTIGSYRYFKRRGKKEMAIQVAVFPLEVTEEYDVFREKGQRDSLWLEPAVAAKLMTNDTLAALIVTFDPKAHAANQRLARRR